MLINAQRPEELRIAIVRGKTLENFQVDVAESGLTRGNIYRGTIVNIQPSLNAAFIDYGAERHGFLAIQDTVPEAYYHNPRGSQPRIDEVLERNKPIVVQVAKDAIGQKGAALTTSLSLAGRYLVLTPFDDTRGVSRKVEDEETRKKLKGLAAHLDLPAGCGVIVRTNALEQNKTALSRDLLALLRLWKRVQAAAASGAGSRGGSRLLYSDQDLIVQALRDHLDSSIEEVLVDDDAAFQKALGYMQAFMPRARTRLVRYEERLPLFSRFEVEPQIERIYERRVELPSGGSIVIDATEALTAIDVNSGRSTRAATQEETALNTNVEAAAEVARQLRLRDIGGLVVVDFIDMRASKNQRRIEKELREAMKADKARSTVGRISPNGLLEINRQRIQQALQVRTHRPCPTCAGVGRLASPEMVSLSLLRRIETRAADGMLQGVRISLHPELADAMQNSRRQELAELEREFDLRIEIIAAAGMHRPDEQIEWIKREKPALPVKRGKAPPPAALQPWDLASTAGFDEDGLDEDLAALGEGEPDEEEAAPRGAAAATREGAAPAANGEGGDAKRGRKRRRGGRKRKRAAGEPAENAAEAGAEPAGHLRPNAAGAGEATAPPEDLPFAGSDFDFDFDAADDDDDDAEAELREEDGALVWQPADAAAGGPAAHPGASTGAGPGAPTAAKRSRRRRRRRGGKGEAAVERGPERTAAGEAGGAKAEAPAAVQSGRPPDALPADERQPAREWMERAGASAWTEQPAPPDVFDWLDTLERPPAVEPAPLAEQVDPAAEARPGPVSPADKPFPEPGPGPVSLADTPLPEPGPVSLDDTIFPERGPVSPADTPLRERGPVSPADTPLPEPGPAAPEPEHAATAPAPSAQQRELPVPEPEPPAPEEKPSTAEPE